MFNSASHHEDALGEWRCMAPCILHLSARLRWWSASCPGCFTHGKISPDTHWIEGWVGPRTSPDMMARREIPSPCWESSPNHPACNLVAVTD